MTDPISGMSRGYGFVRFSDESDQQRALTEMQGVYCGNRPMRISTATPKNKANGGGPGGMVGMQGGMPGSAMGAPGMYPMGAPPMSYYGAPQPMNQFTDPNNTTVFVGGLSGYVTEDELRSFFQGFGEITYVKIPPGKGCGFVQFVQRHAAEMAINQMQGYPIGNSRVRLSWGRSQNNSGPAGTPYRPAPPPPQFQAMGMAPAHPYGNFAQHQVSFPPSLSLITTVQKANNLTVELSSICIPLCTGIANGVVFQCDRGVSCVAASSAWVEHFLLSRHPLELDTFLHRVVFEMRLFPFTNTNAMRSWFGGVVWGVAVISLLYRICLLPSFLFT